MTRRAAHAWLADHPWRYHYEVVVRRHGVEQIVARAHSRREADLVIAQVYRAVEISALIFGLLTSGTSWRRGGADDR